jgi:uncharacterized protein YidB (DUF937 family)
MSGNTVPAAIMQLINDHGGIQGIYNSFQSAGLGNIVDSWIGRDANSDVNPNQLSNVLDPQVVEQSAQQNGMAADELIALAAQYLPMIIDHLTPSGKVPDESQGFLNMAINFLKNRNFS